MTKELNKWADDAMFTAEKSDASAGPQAFLLQGTPDPLGSIAAFAAMYKGEVVRDKRDVTDDERRYYLAEMQKTKLKAPLEAVNLHWMIEGVTRSFTHQMVRQRTAVYAQESLRFAVKEDAVDAVALPPSLAGTVSMDEFMDEHLETFPMMAHLRDTPGYRREVRANAKVSPEQTMRWAWDETVGGVGQIYNDLVNLGMPAEDARGLLPHNITTRLNYATNLRNYQDHAGNRLCTQAQFEWRMVWVRMLEAMREYCTSNTCRWNKGVHSASCDNWQWVAISELFRPVCYYTGNCQFLADFDRKCSIRERVMANASVGRSSSEWHEAYDLFPDGGTAPVVERTPQGVVFIGPIHPAEWLLDAGAAR